MVIGTPLVMRFGARPSHAPVPRPAMRASVRVNRVTVRWEPVATWSELLDAGDELIGANAKTVGDRARDRWIELASHHYLLEMALPLGTQWETARPLSARDDLGAFV